MWIELIDLRFAGGVRVVTEFRTSSVVASGCCFGNALASDKRICSDWPIARSFTAEVVLNVGSIWVNLHIACSGRK